MVSSRVLSFGLAAAALVSLFSVPAAHAGDTKYNYHVTFTTPTPFLGFGFGNATFQFDPSGPNPAQATATLSNLTYSNDWLIYGVSTFGDTTYDSSSKTATINNSTAHNGATVDVLSFGNTFGFDLNYQDPPGTDPTDFSVILQKSGQADVSLFDIQFDPSGAATLMSTTPGVSITPDSGTPPLGSGSGPAPVPEASTTISFGLLLALGLGAVALKKKGRKSGVPVLQ